MAGLSANVRAGVFVSVLCAALHCGASPSLAQSAPRSQHVIAPAKPMPAFAQLQNWIQLSKTHQIGEIDDAVRALGALSVADIRLIDRDLQALLLLLAHPGAEEGTVRTAGRTLAARDLAALFDLSADLFHENGQPLDAAAILRPDSKPRQAIAKILVRAAMLHTDLLTWTSGDDLDRGQAAGAAETSIRVTDAGRRNAPNVDAYWRCARAAMDAAQPTPWGADLVPGWFVATSEYLLNQRDYAAGISHLEHARLAVPGEARVALLLGAAYENLAAPPIQAAFQNGDSALSIGSRPELLRKAEFELRSALLLDPDLEDGQLRLGRTLLLMARPDEAIPMLAHVEFISRRADSKYYAALFGGIAYGEMGNTAESRAAVARAAALFPGAQSPRLALAQLAMLTSAREQALASITALTSLRVETDPWFNYDVALTSDAFTRLMSIRATISDRLR
jgi:hypothetical protein